jgi:DNA-binding transcriptional ArsR family regulator
MVNRTRTTRLLAPASRIALQLADIAGLIGDPSRAHMLSVLMDGRALTAFELSIAAGVTPQTASSHLAKLCGSGLLTVDKKGRRRYYRLASAGVARTLESVMALTASSPQYLQPMPGLDAEFRAARSCYDHLAGQLGVAITDSLVGRGYILFEDDVGEVTDSGQEFFIRLGLDLKTNSRRPTCIPCLDWSERRLHVAGHVGAQIAALCFEREWLTRKRGTRALGLTNTGRRMLPRAFTIELPA